MRQKALFQVLPAVLLLVHAGLLAYGTAVHSPTIDEVGHMATGLWIPLSQYERIIWIADSRVVKGGLETDVQYLGPHGDGPVSLFTSKEDQEKRDVIDYLSGVPKVNGVISFKYGELAYFNNPDPDKERVSVNLVYQATTFINECLKADQAPPGPLGHALPRQQGQGRHPDASQAPGLSLHHLRHPGGIVSRRAGVDADRPAGRGRRLRRPRRQ